MRKRSCGQAATSSRFGEGTSRFTSVGLRKIGGGPSRTSPSRPAVGPPALRAGYERVFPAILVTCAVLTGCQTLPGAVSPASIQYLVPTDLSVGDLTQALAPSFGLLGERAESGERIFYDTFDGRVHQAKMSLVHGRGRIALCSGSEGEFAGVDCPTAPDRLFAGALPRGQLREALRGLTDVRAVARLARVRVRERRLRVLDDQRKTVVRLLLEEPSLVGAIEGQLRPRLSAVAIRGYDKAFTQVRQLLEEQLGLVVVDISLQDEAVIQSGQIPGGVTSNVDIVLRPDESAASAAARICLRLLEVIEVNMAGALADTDSEFLHDLRVAVRRTRAVQRELRKAFPAEPLAHFRAEFRWLQEVTGALRDLDVYLLEFEAFRATLPERQRGGLEPLLMLLTERRRRERRRMVAALRSSRTHACLLGWAALLANLETKGGADANSPVAKVAGARIGRLYARMVKAGSEIDDASPPTALHELRKQGKELRYLLEFFARLYPTDVIKPMVRTLKALQDALGRFQDRQIQADLIQSLGEEVRSLPDGAPALMAMGQLVERLDEQQAQARAEFAARFTAFASRDTRLLVREAVA